MFEGSNIEFKSEYVDDIKKTVIAFANSEGGNLYIGVDDRGNAVGVADVDEVMLRCSNTIRDSIRPDVTMFVSYYTEDREGKQIIRISVQRGSASPYYLESKGLRPSGVYIRHGASTVPASETAIRQMIKETDGDKYERMRCVQQELTFRSAVKEFGREKVPFGKKNMRSLKMINEDGVYTNLAFLLSDQCTHTIKAAVFDGDEKVTFRDRAEFTGSVISQANDAYEYISRYNRTRSEFEGIHRIDIRDYPPEAIREAILNAVVHRDYGFSASILISIFDKRIEIVSIGGLVKGISRDEIFMGLSVQRNEDLANVFYRLNIVEAFGTGIPRIMKLYEKYTAKPVFEVTENAFKITLPCTFDNEPADDSPKKKAENILDDDGIIDMFKSKGVVTRAEIENFIGISSSSALRIIRRLIKTGRMSRKGQGKSAVYLIN